MPDYELNDDWRSNEAPRSKAYEPPASPIFDPEGECVCLRINSKWTPFLTGVLDILTNPALWISEDEEYAPEQIRMLIGALMGEENDMTCLPPIEDILFVDGVLCIVREGECTPISGTERIVTDVNVIGGGALEVEQGGEFAPLSADCETCNEFPDTPAYQGSGDARSCNIATNLTEWLMEKYNDALDTIEAVENTVVAMDLVSILFPPAYLLWDAVNDAVDEWYEAGISIARAVDTVELREEIAQKLYCLMNDDGHIMTESVWSDFKDWIIIDTPLVGAFVWMFEYGGINDQAHKSSYGESADCATFNCTDCIRYVSFEDAPATGIYQIMEGTYETGLSVYDSGVAGADDYLARVRVRFFPPSGASVGEITYHMKAVPTSGAAQNRNMFQIVRGRVGGTTSTLFSATPEGAFLEGVDYERTRTFSANTYEWIELELYCGFTAGIGGKMYMDDVCLK